MTTSTLYHTQGIRGFHYKKTERKGHTEFYHISGAVKHLSCPCCGSKETQVIQTKEQRRIKALPIGLKKRFWSCKSDAFNAKTAALAPENALIFAHHPSCVTPSG